jgi:hypothetical protein
MSRLHSTLIAFLLGAAAATGLFAAVRTVRLGQTVAAAQPVPIARELAARQAKLAGWSRSLQQARAKHPPSLPKLPKFAPVRIPQSAPAAPSAAPVAAAGQPQLTYVRPRAVVKYRHAAAPHTSTGSSKPSSSDDSRSDDGGGDDGSGD